MHNSFLKNLLLVLLIKFATVILSSRLYFLLPVNEKEHGVLVATMLAKDLTLNVTDYDCTFLL